MKLSTLLPILAGANKGPKKKESDRNVGERFVAGDVNELCVNQIPQLGGSFKATNDGSHGEIRLDNYPDNANCKHVVQAEVTCEEIEIKYRSVAVENWLVDMGCDLDSFRFGWIGTSGFEFTPPTCNCFGDGCDSKFYYEETYDFYPYTYTNTGFFTDEHAAAFDSDSLLINSNNFTFFFQTNSRYKEGHVFFDWECVRYATTTETTTSTTTTPATT